MKTALDQLRTALSSAYPLIILVSLEEERIEALLKRFADGARPDPLPLLSWNCVDGFDGREELEDPMEALLWIQSDKAPRGFYLFKDLDNLAEDPRLLRRLRDTAMRVRNSGKFLFLLKEDNRLPASLSPLSYVVLSLFPDPKELRKLVLEIVEQAPEWTAGRREPAGR